MKSSAAAGASRRERFDTTHVDTEGLMRGIDVDAILRVRRATAKPVAAAGGITTRDEIDRLHALRVGAVVGMALYTGRLEPPPD